MQVQENRPAILIESQNHCPAPRPRRWEQERKGSGRILPTMEV